MVTYDRICGPSILLLTIINQQMMNTESLQPSRRYHAAIVHFKAGHHKVDVFRGAFRILW
jgi:hypothetical protein